MKKRYKIAILVLLIVFAVFTVSISYLLTPAIWSKTLVNQLQKQDIWHITFDKISGHLLTTTKITNLNITKNDSLVSFHAPEITFNINPLPWVFKEISLRKLIIDDYSLIYHKLEDTTGSSIKSNNLNNIGIFIKELVIAGKNRVVSNIQGEVQEFDFSFTGRLKYRVSSSFVYIDTMDIKRITGDQLIVRNSGIQIFDNNLSIDNLTGSYNKYPFSFTVAGVIENNPEFIGNLKLDNLTLPMDSTLSGIIHPKWHSADIDIDFKSNLRQHQINSNIYSDIDSIQVRFNLLTENNVFKITDFILAKNNSIINGTGLYEPGQRLNGRFELSNYNISNYLNSAPKTEISGIVLWETAILESGRHHTLVAAELLDAGTLIGENTSLSGTLILSDSVVSTENPLTIITEEGLATITGAINLYNGHSDFNISLNDTRLSLPAKILGIDSLNGLVRGNVKWGGTLGAPVLDIDAAFNKLRYRDLTIAEADIKSQIQWIESQPFGNLVVNIFDANWPNYQASEGFIELSIDSNIIAISSIYLKDRDNFLQLSGILDPYGKLTFDQFRLGYNLHYFVNAQPINLTWKKNSFRLNPFTLHVDDGIIEGFINFADYREGRLKFSNFNSDALLEHLPNVKYSWNGLVFGEITLFGNKGDESIEIELSLKNGQVVGQQFDDLVISSVFYDSVLHIDEFTLTKGKDIGIQFSGVIPMSKEVEQKIQIEMLAELRSVNLDLFRQFAPNFPKMKGYISGEFDFGGTTNDLNFGFDLSIADAVYDRIPLGLVKSKGDFLDEKLTFSYFESKYKNNYLHGKGILPLDYNLSSDNFGKMIPGDSLNLDVYGQTTNLEFLSAYLDVTDSLAGNFDIGFFLSGVPEKIIRDGWLNVADGEIYTVLLDNTVDDIRGSLRITDNLMTVENFKGTLRPTPEYSRRLSIRTALTGQVAEVDNNIDISGTIDFSKFFEPGFNLGISAQNAYIRTLLGDIEGIVDCDISMSGRDTITYSGIITPVNVEMRQEFAPSDVDESTHKQSKIITEYRITFPITGDFKLINSQLDADIIGELSLVQFGEQDMDFAGELFMMGGKFYTTGVVFNINEGGSLIFTGTGFNGDLNIQANTNISDYVITASLSGPIDNPTLLFESTPFLSQTDILSLMTVGKRWEDYDFASEGLGQLTIVGAWFENQLQKNLSQVTRELGLIDEVDISGAGSLLGDNNSEDMTISAQRRLSTNLALNYSYKRSFSLTNPTQQLVGVEYKLNRYLSLVGNYDDAGNLQVKYRLRYSY